VGCTVKLTTRERRFGSTFGSQSLKIIGSVCFALHIALYIALCIRGDFIESASARQDQRSRHFRSAPPSHQRRPRKLVDTNDQWIMERVGIRQRHIVDKGLRPAIWRSKREESACPARNRGLRSRCHYRGTVTPDMFFPSTACLVQHKLGAKNVWDSMFRRPVRRLSTRSRPGRNLSLPERTRKSS